MLSAIDRLRQPPDDQQDEEHVIRSGPDKAGLSAYLASLKRLNRSYSDMQASNLRANQQHQAEMMRLIKLGNGQLEGYFDNILRGETPRSVEPLHFITKNQPFPTIPQETITKLGLLYSYFGSQKQSTGYESPAKKIYTEVRGPYIALSLANLAAASVNTAKKKVPGAMYRAGTNGIGTYAKAMEGIFVAEYDNICSIYTREEWGIVFQSTCQAALTELARTLRELNAHIKGHLSTDCCLAYEVMDILGTLSTSLESRTGELKSSLTATLKPVKETAKLSLSDMLDEIRRRAAGLQSLPPDGAPISLVPETMQRMQTMLEFLRPISSVMISIGDGGWKNGAANGRSTDMVPSLASFDVGADGHDIFANYCMDTIDVLLSSLEAKAKVMMRVKSVQGVFLANILTLVERAIRTSELSGLLEKRLDALEPWRKKATMAYTDVVKDLAVHLFDTVTTSRGQRHQSGPPDSATVVKGLSSKEKDKIKEKFSSFNSAFDDMVAKHKSYNMEREVRAMFGEDIRQKLQPLYDRFWDKYHEIDKGKGKYVKYDKVSMAGVFTTMSS